MTQDKDSPSIIARNIAGDEITITLAERAGLIIMERSDGHALAFVHWSATELCMQLIELLYRQHKRGSVGPFSAKF